MSEQADSSDQVTKRPRWRVPIIVSGLALITHLVGLQLVDDDVSMQSVVTVLSWLIAFLLIAAWWVFFSGARWRTRIAGIAGFICLVGVLLVLFRFDGQTGNFIPQFSFRFSASAEDRALEYFASTNVKQGEPATADSEGAATSDIGPSTFLTTDQDWPRFGGPLGDHIVHGESIRTDWDANPPRALWRHPIGPAWSSFAVVDDFVFTQEQRGQHECVVCYDAADGKQVWLHQDEARFEEPSSGAGPRATPTIHDGRLYSLGATGILNCLDPRTGALLWSTNIVDDHGGDLIEWAVAGSPVIHEDLVLVNPGTTKSFLVAYDRLSGEQRWAAPEARAGYATPVVASIDGQPQVVMYRAAGVGGYSIESGSELWFFEWINATQINVAQPIVLPDESVFISTGYGGGSARLQLSRDGDAWTVDSLWERPNRFKLKFNGGVFHDGYVYGLDEGILSCFDTREGERAWKKGRYKFGQILMVGQHLLVLAEDGRVVLVEATPDEMVEVAEFDAIEGKTWNHPVLNRGRLFVRNGNEVACYDLSVAGE